MSPMWGLRTRTVVACVREYYTAQRIAKRCINDYNFIVREAAKDIGGKRVALTMAETVSRLSDSERFPGRFLKSISQDVFLGEKG